LIAYAVFSPVEYWPLLAGFLAAVALLLAFDLTVMERLTRMTENAPDAAKRRFRVSLTWTLICVGAAIAAAYAFKDFALAELTRNPALLAASEGRYAELTPAEASSTFFYEFLTGYLVELSLSVDNLFVFLVIFRYFGLDHEKQHRVLFWGIVGAVVFRALFIGVGTALVQYQWVLIAMGIFLIGTGVKLLIAEDKKLEPERNPFIRVLSKLLPVSPRFDGARFLTRIDGRLAATPLLVTLVVVETTDIAFAVDSVPAVLAITQEPLVAFASNICAILGLRAMFFVVAEAMQKFHLLKYGLGLVLIWVGLKMTVLPHFFGGHVPVALSLGVIVALIGGTMALSFIIPPRADQDTKAEGDAAEGSGPTHE
jgi:tellurite resistance protein TerC